MKPTGLSSLTKLLIVPLAFLMSCGGDDDEPAAIDCNATGPSISLTPTSSACGQDDGQIELTLLSGSGQLTITITPQPDGSDFDNNVFTGLEPGDYTVNVTDENNCSTSEMATVDFVAGNVSYMNDVDPIIQSKCAIAGCHVAGTGLPDYTNFSELQSRANDQPGGVRQRVKSGDMPRDGDLTAEEISTILCWVDEGAQNN